MYIQSTIEHHSDLSSAVRGIPVHLVVAHSLVELFDVLGELLGLLHQEVNINFVPKSCIPVSEREHDSTNHVPQCLQVTQLLLQSSSITCCLIQYTLAACVACALPSLYC